jgi:hypothetical protein
MIVAVEERHAEERPLPFSDSGNTFEDIELAISGFMI